jgi:3,4-dihydroxy 2-butanone 4-phosphate synthase/GTP cyclohydrolase II
MEGESLDRVEDAVQAVRKGRIVIVVDDEDRENEGDLVIAAEKVTPEAINFMARHGRGLICLSMTGERLDQLHIPMMVEHNRSKYGTAFTVSIEARHGVTTGISAADRARTILTAIHPATQPFDLVQPGHVFPLRARPGGVLERAGQTEASLDLARLAGLYPAGVICEIMNEDGTMARTPELVGVARRHGLMIVSVADIIAYRLRNETFVRKVAESKLPTDYGEFTVAVFENSLDREHHLAFTLGSISPGDPVLVRVQLQSTLGDVFRCARSGGGEQLRSALRMIRDQGRGILVYLRLEGRGDGLADEVLSYAVGASSDRRAAPEDDDNTDLRTYGIGAQILKQLGAGRILLITSHHRKIVGLQGFGLTVVEQVPLKQAAD